MYVCMYIHMYVCMYILMYLCIEHISISAFVTTRTHVAKFIRLYIYVLYIYIYIYIYIYLYYVCTCVCHICMRVCLYVSVCVRKYIAKFIQLQLRRSCCCSDDKHLYIVSIYTLFIQNITNFRLRLRLRFRLRPLDSDSDSDSDRLLSAGHTIAS